MNPTQFTAVEPLALTTFAAGLTNLPRNEIQKAKKLYLLNAIVDFKAQRTAGRTMLIVMGVMSIIPIFLIIFIPALMTFRAGLKAGRQKILNAVEVWKDDLGPDYEDILRQVED